MNAMNVLPRMSCRTTSAFKKLSGIFSRFFYIRSLEGTRYFFISSYTLFVMEALGVAGTRYASLPAYYKDKFFSYQASRLCELFSYGTVRCDEMCGLHDVCAGSTKPHTLHATISVFQDPTMMFLPSHIPLLMDDVKKYIHCFRPEALGEFIIDTSDKLVLFPKDAVLLFPQNVFDVYATIEKYRGMELMLRDGAPEECVPKRLSLLSSMAKHHASFDNDSCAALKFKRDFVALEQIIHHIRPVKAHLVH